MGEAEPSRKRQRTDESTAQPQSPTILRRSNTLYYPNGNIILTNIIPPDASEDLCTTMFHDGSPDREAQGHRNAIAYKVHTDILASHCSFFATLFTGSQEYFSDASEKVDGAPIMELSGDDWQGVDDFLRALYIPQYLSFPNDSLSPRQGGEWIALLARVLTVAKKYKAERIHAIAAGYFRPHWPTKCALWEKDRQPGSLLTANAALAIRIGTDHAALHTILPVAFYELHMALGPKLSLSGENLERPNLAPLFVEDFRRLINGGAAFDTLCKDALSHLEGMDTSSICQRGKNKHSHCRSARELLFSDSRLMGTPSFERRTTRPFLFLSSLEEIPTNLHYVLCLTCRNATEKRVKSIKRDLWKSLPAAFDLVDFVGLDWGAEEGA